jgi:hypothetical protein
VLLDGGADLGLVIGGDLGRRLLDVGSEEHASDVVHRSRRPPTTSGLKPPVTSA